MTQKGIIPISEIESVADAMRERGERIVFTNGCFDLIHPGHVKIIREAASRGDRLIVGLNSDASVRKLKGPRRPILSGDQRGRIVSAMQGVDAVVFFEEDTPRRLIELIRPDVLVKGGDYRMDEVVGRECVWENAGEVVTVKPAEGYSTSALIKEILERFSE